MTLCPLTSGLLKGHFVPLLSVYFRGKNLRNPQLSSCPIQQKTHQGSVQWFTFPLCNRKWQSRQVVTLNRCQSSHMHVSLSLYFSLLLLHSCSWPDRNSCLFISKRTGDNQEYFHSVDRLHTIVRREYSDDMTHFYPPSRRKTLQNMLSLSTQRGQWACSEDIILLTKQQEL